MHINISLRSLLSLFLCALCAYAINALLPEQNVQAIGGPGPSVMQKPSHLRELTIFERKEEILRDHLAELKSEASDVARERQAIEKALMHTSARRNRTHRTTLQERLTELSSIDDDIRDAQKRLVALRSDRNRYEAWVRASVQDVVLNNQYGASTRISTHENSSVSRSAPSASSAHALNAAQRDIGPPAPLSLTKRLITNAKRSQKSAQKFVGTYSLAWPVTPLKGISAEFHDEGYTKRFGFEHNAIDIPIAQGSAVRAASDGIILESNDRGFGYNTIVIDHGEGLTTVYGHVSQLLVKEGDRVEQGEVIALSGGRPGSKGAGFITTGPHLHFEVKRYGMPIDPMYVLAPLEIAMNL